MILFLALSEPYLCPCQRDGSVCQACELMKEILVLIQPVEEDSTTVYNLIRGALFRVQPRDLLFLYEVPQRPDMELDLEEN
jgi:hypothetical protein